MEIGRTDNCGKWDEKVKKKNKKEDEARQP